MIKNRWILPYIRQYRNLLILTIFLGSLTIVFGGGLMVTSGYLISKAATRPESILMIYVPIVGVRTFGIGRSVLSYVERLTGHQFILKMLSSMRVRLYKVIEPQVIIIRSRFSTGEFLGILADDIEHLQDFYLKTLFPSIISLVIYTIIIICTGLFSIGYAIVFAILIGQLVFVGPIISLIYTKKINRQLKQGKHHLYLQLTDAVFGISDWLFSGRYTDYIHSYEEEQETLLQLEKKKVSFANWRDMFIQVLVGIIVVVAIYWASGMKLNGRIPGTFIAAISLGIMSIMESFLSISGVFSDITTYQDSLSRLNNLDKKTNHIIQSKEADLPLEMSDVTIDIQDVSFHYQSEIQLIQHINLRINQGEKVALLGPSGAGKSTLLNLMQGGIRPTDGQVLINKVNAHNIYYSIPKMMAVLNQKAYLFHTTVMNNIRLGKLDATDEEVYDVAEQVELHDMIKSLPNGYNTSMHEAGQRFSGGERQRIALARILLQNTPIVIMDEPTVGLDSITENKLLKTIFNTLNGKTIIWVTHHLAGMSEMDRVIFMEKGKFTMTGNHQHLLDTSERYRRLYRLDHPFNNRDI